MLSLACKDLGSRDCNYSATGRTAGAVEQARFAHAQHAHPDVLASNAPRQMQDIQERMDQLLRQALGRTARHLPSDRYGMSF